MKPINFISANKTLHGHNENVAPLPVYQGQGMFISRWKADWRERLSVLIHGTIWVCIVGDKHPPLAISGCQSGEFRHPDARR